MDSGIDFDKCSMDEIELIEKNIFNEVIGLLEIVAKLGKKLIIVTNEVGMDWYLHID